MEFCDRGCLTDAIHEGRFLVPGTQRLNMVRADVVTMV